MMPMIAHMHYRSYFIITWLFFLFLLSNTSNGLGRNGRRHHHHRHLERTTNEPSLPSNVISKSQPSTSHHDGNVIFSNVDDSDPKIASSLSSPSDGHNDMYYTPITPSSPNSSFSSMSKNVSHDPASDFRDAYNDLRSKNEKGNRIANIICIGWIVFTFICCLIICLGILVYDDCTQPNEEEWDGDTIAETIAEEESVAK